VISSRFLTNQPNSGFSKKLLYQQPRVFRLFFSCFEKEAEK